MTIFQASKYYKRYIYIQADGATAALQGGCIAAERWRWKKYCNQILIPVSICGQNLCRKRRRAAQDPQRRLYLQIIWQKKRR